MAAMDAGDAGQDAARDAREDVPADRLTVAEAARQLGISTAALRKRIKRGTLPALKVGEQWYVTREGVDAARAAARSAAPDTSSPSGSPTGRDAGHSPGTGQV
jgi:excisionase family DNA binding protein